MYALEGDLVLRTTALPSPAAAALVPPTGGPLSEQTFGIPMDDPHSMTDPWRSNSDFLVILLTHAITFIVGVIGNTIVIATWARGGKIRSPTATFLVSLACADLLLLTVFLPLETLEYFVITWDREGHICKLSSFVELLSGIASILNLVAVSVERFLVIVYPIQARRWCTVTKSRRSLLLVWVLAVIFAAPPVFNKSTYSITYYNNETSLTAYYCFEKNDSWAVAVSVYELLTLFVIPALLMLFCYFRVIRELWASTRVITILTSASSGGGRGGGGGTSPTRQASSSIRSYLVRWPAKKQVTVSVNCPGATSNTTPAVPKITRPSKSSVSSSGVSSSSTSKGLKGGLPHCPPSAETADTEATCPPDSPMAHGLDTSPCRRSSAFCKLFACLHHFRTLCLRPCASKGGACGAGKQRPGGSKCAKLSHHSHHRCRHHHHSHSHSPQQQTHFKVAPGGEHHHHHHHASQHHCAHCHLHQAHTHAHGQQCGRVGVPYREVTVCCPYKCTAASCPVEVSSSSSHGIDSERESSVSVRSSGTCATSSSQRNTVLITSPSTPPPPTLQVALSSPKGRHKALSLLTCCSFACTCSWTGGRVQGPQSAVPPQSPYEMRNSRQALACRASQRASYTLTSSFTNVHTSSTTATGTSTYNMLAINGHAQQGVVTFGCNGVASSNLHASTGTSTAAKAINLSVNSNVASSQQQQVTSVTLQTPSTSTGHAMPAMYRHSTASGYRAPVTDVRNARKQLYCQVIKMLITIEILFAVCWGPRLIFNVFKSAGITYFNTTAYNARVYFYLLSFIHSALNPFVYGFMSSNFRRMMLNSCNHQHGRHRHDHEHHNSYQANNSMYPGGGGTGNSLMDAINTTSCLNMAHLKASLTPLVSTIRRSNSDMYERGNDRGRHPAQAEMSSSGGGGGKGLVASWSSRQGSKQQAHSSVSVPESEHREIGEKSASKTNLSIESDGAVSYAAIETEIQRAVHLMSADRQVHQLQMQQQQQQSETLTRPSRFIEQLFSGRSLKLDRSSSLFFTFKGSGSGGGKVKASASASRASLESRGIKKKWSDKFLRKTRSNRSISPRCIGGPRCKVCTQRRRRTAREHSF